MVSSYAYAMVLLGGSAGHSYLNRQSQVYRSALEHSRDRIMIFGFSDISTSPVCRVDDAGNRSFVCGSLAPFMLDTFQIIIAHSSPHFLESSRNQLG